MAAQDLGVSTHPFDVNTKTEDIERFYNSYADQYDEVGKFLHVFGGMCDHSISCLIDDLAIHGAWRRVVSIYLKT